jgi:general secretion pathway protein A
MYESHFGLGASPFQLNPDPSFYFDSKGHSNAMAYLRYGAYQAEGFIVVTGEIGAGKTTLVRALLSELDSERIVAGQVVSTQLEAGDLLRSILAAFGVQAAAASKAALISSLEAFLTLVASRGQRALLIVDEAQNLGPEAVEELRMLSNFQLGNHALLQSFLVGQPDLRQLLQSPSMEQLRQRVIASCHLGPLDAAETEAYILHRLRHVGWVDRPRFEPGTFEAIHRWTQGIPRRINLLCNRLLLGAYLVEGDVIDAAFVERVVHEVQTETGTPARLQQAAPPPPPPTPSRTAPALPSGPAAQTVRTLRTPGVEPVNPVLCLATSAAEFLRARALAACLDDTEAGAGLAIVTPHGLHDLQCDDAALLAVPAAPMEIHLGLPPSGPAAHLAAVLTQVDALLAELAPPAVIVQGNSDAALATALAAHQRGLRILRAEAAPRVAGERTPVASNGALIDRLATLIVTDRISDHAALAREGVPAERVLCLGTLAADVAQRLRQAAPPVAQLARRYGVPASTVQGRQGHAVATLRIPRGELPDQRIADFLGQWRGLPPLLWVVDAASDDAIRAGGLARALDSAQVVLLPDLALPDAVALLSGATCLVCDARRELADLAQALDVPCVELGVPATTVKTVAALASRRTGDEPTETAQHSGAGRGIAEQLSLWLQP